LKLRNYLQSNFVDKNQRIAFRLALFAYAFSVPVSNFFGQVTFFALLICALPRAKAALKQAHLDWLLKISIAWIFILVISTGVAVDPLNSLPDLFKALLYLFLPFAISDYFGGIEDLKERLDEVSALILTLALGQGVTSLHSILATAFDRPFKMGFTGEVTESGQLALVIPALLGLIVSLRERVLEKIYKAYGSLLALSLILLGWGRVVQSQLGILLQFGAALCALSIFAKLRVFVILRHIPKLNIFEERTLAFVLLPVLSSAFLFNLKRGPWFGVFVALIVVGGLLKPKLAVKTALMGALAVVGLQPVRERILNFAADFTISGGRMRMWELGVEIVERFPLGVGLQNSVFMRTLDPYLPPTHRHMHNNFLNILVETGYLGLAVYLWWIFAVIGYGFSHSQKIKQKIGLDMRGAFLGVFLGASLLSWQLAGISEYNFGDAEIRMIAFLIVGILVSLPRATRESP